jgi:hypothetical protein
LDNSLTGQKAPGELCSVIIELVPKKLSATALSEEKDLFQIILLIGDHLYAVDVDAIKSLGHIDTKNKDFFSRDHIKADRKSLVADMFRIERGTAAIKRISPSTDRATKKMIEGLFSAMKTNVANVPVTGIASSVEQPVIDEMIDRATEIIGSREEAMRWLGTPVRALNFATPVSMLGAKDGVERVNDVLGQMEYGIW